MLSVIGTVRNAYCYTTYDITVVQIGLAFCVIFALSILFLTVLISILKEKLGRFL